MQGDGVPPIGRAEIAAVLVRLLGLFLGLGYGLAAFVVVYCHQTSNHTRSGDVCEDVGARLERIHAGSLQTLVTLLAGAGLSVGR
jgi:hypothetical protein